MYEKAKLRLMLIMALSVRSSPDARRHSSRISTRPRRFPRRTRNRSQRIARSLTKLRRSIRGRSCPTPINRHARAAPVSPHASQPARTLSVRIDSKSSTTIATIAATHTPAR